jgi:hypothetical protein
VIKSAPKPESTPQPTATTQPPNPGSAFNPIGLAGLDALGTNSGKLHNIHHLISQLIKKKFFF